MRVFKNQFNGWETLFKNKTFDGSELRYYMPIQFQKGQEPVTSPVDIKLIQWFGSCFKRKNNEVAPKIFIMKYELENSTAANMPSEYNPFDDVPREF